MPLGFNLEAGSSGDILPIVKWDAKAGDMIQQDRHQGPDGVWVKDEKELSLPLQVAMDDQKFQNNLEEGPLPGWTEFEMQMKF